MGGPDVRAGEGRGGRGVVWCGCIATAAGAGGLRIGGQDVQAAGRLQRLSRATLSAGNPPPPTVPSATHQ